MPYRLPHKMGSHVLAGMSPRLCLLLAAALAFLLPASPAFAASDALRIFFIDVEGGQATLFVTPAGQSLLIDTGWPGNAGRDADRIALAAKTAGLKQIDYVLITHFHTDHVGGVPQLVERIPVGTFIDHGPNRELDGGITEAGYKAYTTVLSAGHAKHLTLAPGDAVPIAGMEATVISSDGALIGKALSGAGETNPFCQATTPRPPDQTENSRSLGIEVNFGKLRILDLGDLTSDKEIALMCPANKLGHIDLLIVSHHGWYQSSSPALVHAIHPRIAIMDNGETKGGSTPVLDTIQASPGLEALWQLHFSAEGGPAKNTSASYIANLPGPDAGNYLEVTAAPGGAFDVLNGRTGLTKHYTAAP